MATKTAMIALAIIILITGVQTRPRADDLCIAAGTQEKGVFGYTEYMYDTWTGRWAYLLTHSLMSYAEPLSSALLPVFLLVGLVAAWFWASGQFWLVLLAVIVWACIAPSPTETIFWSAGSLVYAFPLILSGLLAGMIRRKWHWSAIALLAFFTGGYVETLDLLLCMMLALVWTLKPQFRRETGVAIFFILLSLAIVYLAPGNAIRSLYFPNARQLIPALGIAYYSMSEYLLSAFRWVILLLCLAWMSTGTSGSIRRIRYRAGWATLVLALLVLSIYTATFTTAYAQAIGPPPRMLLVVNAWLVAACIFWGILAGKKPRWAEAACTIVLVLWCAHWAQSAYIAYGQAREWDARHSMLVAARGSSSITIPGIAILGDFEADPEHWVNDCGERWYQIGAIMVTDNTAANDSTDSS